MDDRQLLRYSRHILLNEIGIEKQERLLDSTVLVVGCGGLGSAVLPYLAAAGVGTLIIADHDYIDETNLQRQICYTERDIGRFKAEVAAEFLYARNHDCHIEVHTDALDADGLQQLLPHCDVVLDCSDNAATRHAINAAAVLNRTPLVSGAAVGFSGQLAVFRTDLPDCACYACIFGMEHGPDQVCATFGVFAPLVGVIGTAQAVETLKLLMDLPVLDKVLRCYDALNGTWQNFSFVHNPHCLVCGQS